MEPIEVWGQSLDHRIQAYNEQRALVERQFGEVAAARQGLDAFGEELKLEIEAFQAAKTQRKPVQSVPGSIPPLRPPPVKAPVIEQEGVSEGLPDADSFLGEEEEEVPEPPRPQPVAVKPPQVQKPQPIVPPEPVKGAFDSKALFNRLK